MTKPLFLLYGKYEKKLPQALPYKKTVKNLEEYFKNNTKYNIYGLSAHFNMSLQRFTTQYIKHKDEKMRALIQAAITEMTNHALQNEEDYSKTLRYIMARANVGKDFIELDEQVQASQSKVLVLPEKDIKDN